MEEDKIVEHNVKEEEENKTKKILLDKINEKIAKDKQRTEMRKLNSNQYKKLEMSNIFK